MTCLELLKRTMPRLELEPDTRLEYLLCDVAGERYPYDAPLTLDALDRLELTLSPNMRAGLEASVRTIEEKQAFVRLCHAARNEVSLREWLDDVARTRADVVQLFVKTIQRNKRENAR